MIRLGLLLTALVSCNQWVRPKQPVSEVREAHMQKLLAVKVEMRCGDSGKTHYGSGVMVSDWQVLTAMHVVDCQTAIANIHVTTNKGRFRFASEKEWAGADISRIQMASADTLGIRVSPPTVRVRRMMTHDQVYIQAAMPKREELYGECSGYTYGGAEYGSKGYRTFSYTTSTQPGNSGSGVYDIDGNLVGIHVRHSDETEYGYASIVLDEMIPR